MTETTHLPFNYSFYGQDKELASEVIDSSWSGRQFLVMEQTHQDLFSSIDEQSLQQANTDENQRFFIPKVDAVITQLDQLAIVIKSADCLPISIYTNHTLAAIHASRQTITMGLPGKVALAMKEIVKRKNSTSSEVLVHFGPHICEQCYQIDRQTDTHFNLQQQAQVQIRAIFPRIRLIRNQECTCHQPNKYYSYRRQGKGVPMNYTVVGLR